MHLRPYLDLLLKERGRGRVKQLASDLGISKVWLHQIAGGKKAASVPLCVKIEQMTQVVTRRELRPNDWWLCWPDLVTPQHQPPALQVQQQAKPAQAQAQAPPQALGQQ